MASRVLRKPIHHESTEGTENSRKGGLQLSEFQFSQEIRLITTNRHVKIPFRAVLRGLPASVVTRCSPKAHACELAREAAAFAQALELLLHHRVLLQQLVHFLHAGS